MAGNVWVVAEHWKGTISDATYELLALGRGLADSLGVRLEAVLLGHGVRGLAASLGAADAVLYVDHPALADATGRAGQPGAGRARLGPRSRGDPGADHQRQLGPARAAARAPGCAPRQLLPGCRGDRRRAAGQEPALRREDGRDGGGRARARGAGRPAGDEARRGGPQRRGASRRGGVRRPRRRLRRAPARRTRSPRRATSTSPSRTCSSRWAGASATRPTSRWPRTWPMRSAGPCAGRAP